MAEYNQQGQIYGTVKLGDRGQVVIPSKPERPQNQTWRPSLSDGWQEQTRHRHR